MGTKIGSLDGLQQVAQRAKDYTTDQVATLAGVSQTLFEDVNNSLGSLQDQVDGQAMQALTNDEIDEILGW